MPDASGTHRFSRSRPRVSVVTPSYNQGAFIERTILSVLNQDYPDVEYIVMDSMSNDKTAALLQKYGKRISRVVREKDKGQSDAINKGFQLATGDILAYLNTDDCYATPHVLSQAVEYFLNHSQADLIYGRRNYIDQNGFLIIAHPYRPFDKELLYKACYIGQECTFWTRELYDRAGGYVDSNFKFAVDYELWLRFLAHGGQFHAVDSLFGLFRWYPDQKSNAIWEQVGLPEIAKLQRQYLGYVMEPTRMAAAFEEHFSLVNRFEHGRATQVYNELWRLQTHIRRMVQGRAPMDHWVFLQQEALNEIGYSRAGT